MPRPPGIIDRVNYVIESLNNPCNAPWAVYLETAGPAALDALIALVCFDFLDIIRWLFRPAGIRSGRHLGRGRRGKKRPRRAGLPTRALRKLPGVSALQNRKVTNGVRTLWVIDGIGQRLLWWWLVIDVATGFLYNWTSAVRKTEFCQMADSGGAALNTGPPGGVLAIQGWQGVAYQNDAYQRGAVSINQGGGSVGPGRYQVVASYQMQNLTQATTQCGLRIIIGTAAGSGPQGESFASLNGGGQAGMVSTASFQGPGTYSIEAIINFGGGTGINGSVFVMGLAEPPDPPVKFKCPFFYLQRKHKKREPKL